MHSDQAAIPFRLALVVVALGVLAAFSLGSPADTGITFAGEAGRPGLNPRCTDCHAPDPLFSHPVDFAPSQKLPKGFPLFNGQMTCATCHDDQWPKAHAMARTEGNSLLRASLFSADFCSNCHERASSSPADMHAHTLSRAHLAWDDDAPSFGAGNEKIESGYVGNSQLCMSCHDGFVASSATEPHGGFSSPLAQANSSDHPVGMEYRQANPRDADGGLVPVSVLNPRIRLFDNRVECESCHSMYSEDRDKLVIATTQTELCLSCHDY